MRITFIPAVVMLALALSAVAGEPETKPATQPKPKELLAVLGAMPKELWPNGNETTITASKRDEWLKANATKILITVKAQIVDVTAEKIEVRGPDVNLWGMPIHIDITDDLGKEAVETFASAKAKDPIRIEGTVEIVQMVKGHLLLAVKLTGCKASK